MVCPGFPNTRNTPFDRILKLETGLDSIYKHELIGAYDHIYEDNFDNVPGINTHYVVLAFKLSIKTGDQVIHDNQHSEYKWWNLKSLMQDKEVHQNTKNYFF